jgi:hypothetical protein
MLTHVATTHQHTTPMQALAHLHLTQQQQQQQQQT